MYVDLPASLSTQLSLKTQPCLPGTFFLLATHHRSQPLDPDEVERHLFIACIFIQNSLSHSIV